jgi:hypothetical protein
MAGRPIICTRLPPEFVERLDATAAALSKRVSGVEVARAAVLRLAAERGLPLLEAEAGIKPPKRGRK